MPLRVCLFLLIAAAQLGAQQQQIPPLARLRSNIERITKSVSADRGIYIKCLETGEEIAIDADLQMDTMGVIKILSIVPNNGRHRSATEQPKGLEVFSIHSLLDVLF